MQMMTHHCTNNPDLPCSCGHMGQLQLDRNSAIASESCASSLRGLSGVSRRKTWKHLGAVWGKSLSGIAKRLFLVFLAGGCLTRGQRYCRSSSEFLQAYCNAHCQWLFPTLTLRLLSQDLCDATPVAVTRGSTHSQCSQAVSPREDRIPAECVFTL
jgi:hypothetical protein